MLWTDRLDVRVTGLPPSTDVTLTARFTGWGSSATFTSDANGTVDVATMAPTAGSYAGVDADGLVWSMTASTSPDDPAGDPYALRVYVDVGGARVASGSLARYAQVGVTCADVGESGLVGYFCAPKGAPPRHAVVTFGGSEGGLDTGRAFAKYFASLGYPSLGLAYFGAAGLPAELALVPLEYFATAFSWLHGRPEVLAGKLVAVGGSRGGELALLLGASFPEVTGVIAALPSGVSWGGPSAGGTTEVASWTLGGKPIPWVPFALGAETPVMEPGGVTAYSDTPLFQAAMMSATPAEIAAATTRVEATQGPVLMFAGASDQLWPSCDLAKIAMDRLVATGHAAKYPDELDCYPDAGHTVDEFDLAVPTATAMYTQAFGETLALGGTARGIAHAARDADDKTRAFLKANLD